jgi:predicted dienelactone hydrolase
MKRQPLKLLLAAAGCAVTLASTCAHAAGYQHGVAADPGGKPIAIGIWYPSTGAAKPLSLGPTTMDVAVNAPMTVPAAVTKQAGPMVVISHGTGGSFLGQFDTAIALADAGYVVVALNHTGDNYADNSRSLDVMDRPRQVSRVIDHMLTAWAGRAAIDPQRIGILGHSAGGFTALASIGGQPNFLSVAPMCQQHPGDFACLLLAQRAAPATAPDTGAAADARIKAAVVLAPALGFTFAPDGLKKVVVPVQLWRAENDTLVPHPRYAQAVHDALPQAPDYRVVPGAGHFDFLAPCSDALAAIAPAICTSALGFDRAAFHASFNAEVVQFFNRALAQR